MQKQSRLGEGDEGIVYSNNDGSVTKVFHEKGKSMEEVKAIYDKLNSIGIKTPKILEIGKTEEGLPALRMEQIGDGDPLRMQLLMRRFRAPIWLRCEINIMLTPTRSKRLELESTGRRRICASRTDSSISSILRS